ncbi:MAG: peroxiredoxin [Methylovulum sp.]|nr:peroxiredoxin [Methylovulum sp.]
MTLPCIGTRVPDLELTATGAKTVKFSDYRGHYLLLYFYPKDNTPGCTQEGLAFSTAHEEFTALNAVILGVSRDSVKTHENFKCKQAFAFDLLSDNEEQLCNLFGVIKLKNMYGKSVRGIERSTFLLSPDGVLIHEWRKVKVKGHCDDVLAVLRTLTATNAK